MADSDFGRPGQLAKDPSMVQTSALTHGFLQEYRADEANRSNDLIVSVDDEDRRLAADEFSENRP